jgi:Ran GTPase-activating protein (RanGAP) involved in mRNA processing and transport
MSNMSYCRFENTLADLEDCQDNFDNTNSIDEAQAAIDLYRLCATIVNSVSLAELEDRLDTLTRQETDDEDEDEDENQDEE